MSDRTKNMVVNQLRKRGIIDTNVLDAMSTVPRPVSYTHLTLPTTPYV